jgi:hypothetical protein
MRALGPAAWQGDRSANASIGAVCTEGGTIEGGRPQKEHWLIERSPPPSSLTSAACPSKRCASEHCASKRCNSKHCNSKRNWSEWVPLPGECVLGKFVHTNEEQRGNIHCCRQYLVRFVHCDCSTALVGLKNTAGILFFIHGNSVCFPVYFFKVRVCRYLST